MHAVLQQRAPCAFILTSVSAQPEQQAAVVFFELWAELLMKSPQGPNTTISHIWLGSYKAVGHKGPGLQVSENLFRRVKVKKFLFWRRTGKQHKHTKSCVFLPWIVLFWASSWNPGEKTEAERQRRDATSRFRRHTPFREVNPTPNQVQPSRLSLSAAVWLCV